MTVDDFEILLVEDNPQDAELTIRSLKANNLANRLRHVKDGAEALSVLFDRNGDPNPDAAHLRVILLDLKLPKVSGLEVLARLKADERTRAVPVVVLTSSQEEPDIRECYRLGVNSFVVKPMDFDQFNRAVTQLGLYWLLVNRPRP